MSCIQCSHLGSGRWCGMKGAQVKRPSAGTCRYESHAAGCDCAACDPGCGWCGTPLDEDQKFFCSKGCARAAESDRA